MFYGSSLPVRSSFRHPIYTYHTAVTFILEYVIRIWRLWTSEFGLYWRQILTSKDGRRTESVDSNIFTQS